MWSYIADRCDYRCRAATKYSHTNICFVARNTKALTPGIGAATSLNTSLIVEANNRGIASLLNIGTPTGYSDCYRNKRCSEKYRGTHGFKLSLYSARIDNGYLLFIS